MTFLPPPRRCAAVAVLLLAAACGGEDVAVAPSSPSDATQTASAVPSPSPTPATPTPTDGDADPATGSATDPGGGATASDAPTRSPAATAPATDPAEACGEEDFGITLVAPQDGATIGDGFVLTGCGSTFEAAYQWEVVYDDGGRDEGFGTMTCGTGCIGTFEQPLELTGEGPATLTVFDTSAEDGARTNEVVRRVTVE